MTKTARFKRKKVPATTQNITKGVVNFIASQGHSASRVNVMGIYKPGVGYIRSGSRKGFYDIAATIRTRYLNIEGQPIGVTLMIDVKRGADKLSEDQLEFKREIEEAGGLTFETENYHDFVEWWQDFIKTNYL